ncbi:response regulator transcription factor [Alkalicoccus luteus]|uniref:Response regulator transcription factor n=1 Tax=Alkalicoccus luteus TaxID=1237094 RepID=A0A969PPN4_9BACI|nr:response regulator transcription factor [Alkalicoccus luteus]NJP36121.1 response regulator transcription factor [Alkalicoccus luteus]
MQQTILLADRDPDIRSSLREELEKEGYDIIEAVTVAQAKEQFNRYIPCLVMTERTFEDASGDSFCTWILEQKQHHVSIIMVTSLAAGRDKIEGLRLGADDYMTKPVDAEEAAARAEAVLRRSGQFCQKISDRGLVMKPRRGEVLIDGRTIPMTRIEFTILFYLMDHPDTVHSRNQLINQVYPNAEDTVMDRTIDAHVKKLREKIEADPSSPKRIITVRGHGYMYRPERPEELEKS